MHDKKTLGGGEPIEGGKAVNLAHFIFGTTSENMNNTQGVGKADLTQADTWCLWHRF